LLILDFSVVVGGYRGDFANTICVGRPSPRQQETFDACRQALERVQSLLVPNTHCRDIDRRVRDELRARGFAADRPGHVGHGIGLAHPEAPFFVAESDELLRDDDVVTLEPSLFPDDLVGGVRVEHNYHITPDGPVRLSAHPLGLDVGHAL
jgi:Xaa-Pro aminopeptidase